MRRDRDWWDRYFLALAKQVSTASKDPSTKVGAVLVQGNRVVGMGYNGFPVGVDDSEERYNNRDLKLAMVCHAETNAIIMAGDKAKGTTLYVWPSFMLPPICNECAKIAIQAGIAAVVGFVVDESRLNERQLRWKESIEISRIMCDEAGVIYRGVSE